MALMLFVGAGGCRGILGLEELDLPRSTVAAAGGPAFAGAGSADGGEAGDARGAGGAGSAAGGSAGRGGGAGGSASGRGGAGGASGRGGAGARGGESGADGRGGTAGKSSDAGSPNPGGSGGVAGEPVFPSAGEPCREPGRLACAEPASLGRLLCEGQTWRDFDDCEKDQLCDRSTGACGLQDCEVAGPIECTVDLYDLRVCDPDLVSARLEHCPFGCNFDARACNKPRFTERLIDRTSSEYPSDRPWPELMVPVCFEDVGPSTLALRDALRLAVDSTWGRFSGLGFEGFGECDGSQPAIEVAFVEECRDDLARVSGIGYRGSGEAFRVELCLSHFDPRGDRRPPEGGPIDVELVTFVAKHAFGHALGLENQHYDRDALRLMAEVLDVTKYGAIPFDREHAGAMQHYYGNKPAGSLLGENGRCLADRAGELVYASCDGAPGALFGRGAATTVNVETGACLQANGASVTLEPCEGDANREAFELAHVRWLASGGQCVTAREPPSSRSSPLQVGPCDATWQAAGLFAVEVTDTQQVRIRTAGGACVTWPAVWVTAAVPELAACGGPRDTFDPAFGRLAIDGRCLTVLDGAVEFSPCLGYDDQRFAVSGPFELGGNALTLSGVEQPVLELLPLSFPPARGQVFDWYFSR
jgi:hypothetical protein